MAGWVRSRQVGVVVAAVMLAIALGFGRRAGPSPDAVPETPSAPVVAKLAEPTPAWMSGSLVQPAAVGSAMGLVIGGADGSAPQVLVSGFDQVERPAWSPDHQTLAFAALRDSNWDVWAIESDGSELRRLTNHPGYDGDPAWSPSGEAIAFSSYRDGDAEIYRMAAPGDAGTDANLDSEATRLTNDPGPDVEPSWTPDGRSIVLAAFRDGVYRLEAIAVDGTGRSVLAVPPDGADLRSPSWSPTGDRLAALEVRHGAGRPVMIDPIPGGASSRTKALASSADALAWLAGGEALAYRGAGTDGAVLGRSLHDFSTRTLQASGAVAPLGASTGPGRSHFAWSPLPPDRDLAGVGPTPERAGTDMRAAGREPAAPTEFVGLAVLDDIDVSGPRINAALASDFAGLRAEIAAGAGRDFLARMSDMWRPLTFFSSASAYFSWHKTGRAFDTAMEFRGADGGPGMILVREDISGRTYWRMFLRAGVQNGSVGRPLSEPGWSFSAGGGGEGPERDGGRRARAVPDGYWIDFTAAAGRHGWRRIPSLTRASLDWRVDWAAIEYWHYERRDGLTWFEAAQEVYAQPDIAAGLDRERLERAGVTRRRLSAAGVPSGWEPEG